MVVRMSCTSFTCGPIPRQAAILAHIHCEAPQYFAQELSQHTRPVWKGLSKQVYALLRRLPTRRCCRKTGQ